jgi:malate dehydrogenase (oxaloacetate-decarboxylating)
MAVAGVITANRHIDLASDDLRFVISGAGSAGYGIAQHLAFAMEEIGVDKREAWRRIFVLDSRGLLLSDRRAAKGIKAELATKVADVADWDECEYPPSLVDVVRNVQPTVLIGVSGQAGLFTREVIVEMAKSCDQPIIMPLSNPTSHSEVTPANAIAWTDGRAIVATGSPFGPVVRDGVVHRIGQANNVFIFPGMGLGVLAVGAREVTDGMFLAAARALAEATSDELVEAGQIYPDIDDVREVSRSVAIAVANQAVTDGVADPVEDLESTIDAEMWFPDYLPARAASAADST